MIPTRHALLRDRRSWEASLRALVADDDGVLQLASLPRPAEDVDLPPPYAVDPSGLAAAGCGQLFVADTEHDRVLFLDDFCASRAVLPSHGCAGAGLGQFRAPRGLSFDATGLDVADSGNARVQRLRDPDLQVTAVWPVPAGQPWQVARDTLGRRYVLDHSARRVLRYGAQGNADTAYNAALAAKLGDPAYLALAPDGTLFVSDRAPPHLCRFDAQGAALDPIAAPDAGWLPGALALDGSRLFVADGAGGAIWAFALGDGGVIGTVPGYRGPVTALALAEEGTLYVKPGADATVVACKPPEGWAAAGELVAGPLDAGEQSDWERVVVEAQLPAGSSVALDVFFDEAPSPAPAAADWIAAPSADVLLVTLGGAVTLPGQRRYLWIRVRLSGGKGGSPRLSQVSAATAEESYLQWLPAVYQREGTEGFLGRLLALVRSEVGGGEALLEELPRMLAPDFAPAAALDWLAQWLAFELPPELPAAARRELVGRIWSVYRRRGTVPGLIEAVQIHTGARPQLYEWFRARRTWLLGEMSALGFDTALPAASAEGLVLPGSDALYECDEPRGCGTEGTAAPSTRAGTVPAFGCAEPERVVVGHAVVGVDRPAAAADLGAALFEPWAHRMTVLVPPGHAPDGASRDRIREVVAREKPAHVAAEVCFVEPRMRIGMQALIGIDSVLPGAADPMRLAQSALGQESVLGGDPASAAGQRSRIGRDFTLA